MHSLDSVSAVADTAGNKPSRTSSSSRRRGKDPSKVKATPPPVSPKDVWVEFVDMCNSDAFQGQSKKNTENRNKVKVPCTTGRTSMAVVRHNLAMEKNVPNEDAVRADVFNKAHTKVDKTYQCPEIIRKQSDLNRECNLNGCPKGIVAYGIVVDVSPDAHCHNEKLGDGYNKIEILNVINEDAILSMQDSFTKTMEDVGIGGFVAWPKSFIHFAS
ncbi:hypothetical protein GIB67_000494 [Kingdonia uniflora]|uniref:DUF8039 domain-containing protein n=1 Tax=Kingdonia uniflora TaxID=39325 RepID=A0A7J7L0D8_9MAGN|nr:hypothetical protein GIB67_000494 [Kingdonia uniflora]